MRLPRSLVRRSPAIRAVTAIALAAATMTSARGVNAQTPSAAGFQVDRFVIPVEADDLFWAERPTTTPHFETGSAAALVYQHAPLGAGVPGDAATTPPVSNDLRLHVALVVGLFDRVALGVSLPLVVWSDAVAVPS